MKLSTRFGFWWEEHWIWIVGGLVFLVLIIQVAVEIHDPCLEWRETGGMTCHTIGDVTTCQPDRVCIRRQSHDRP